ncbi:MAG TPA: PIN domain-containing protein [Thermoanaerobaculia bacterium]|nr:PIN domain-containing protein [Thermoanaerobaculia bacterium]
MRVVFADTGYLIALVNPKDALHETAISVSTTLRQTRLVTSEMVLTEVLNHFSKRGVFLRRATINLVEQLQKDPKTSIVPQSSSQFQEALSLYSSRGDKTWSHTDCASFQIMERESIAEALTYDRHFEQSGFKPLLRGGLPGIP